MRQSRNTESMDFRNFILPFIWVTFYMPDSGSFSKVFIASFFLSIESSFPVSAFQSGLCLKEVQVLSCVFQFVNLNTWFFGFFGATLHYESLGYALSESKRKRANFSSMIWPLVVYQCSSGCPNAHAHIGNTKGTQS